MIKTRRELKDEIERLTRMLNTETILRNFYLKEAAKLSVKPTYNISSNEAVTTLVTPPKDTNKEVLELLLEFEPGLEKYRKEETRTVWGTVFTTVVWDVEGLKRVKQLRADQKLVEKYAEPVVKVKK